MSVVVVVVHSSVAGHSPCLAIPEWRGSMEARKEASSISMTLLQVTSMQFFPMVGAALVWKSRLPDGSVDCRMRQTEMPMCTLTRYHLTCHVRAPSDKQED